MLDRSRRDGLDRVRGVGGIGVIPRDWRARLPRRPRKRLFGRGGRLDPRALWARRRRDLRAWWGRRPDARDLWRRKPTGDELLALARKHKVLLAGLTAAAVFATGDTSFAGTVTDRTPAPDRAQRVAVAYPLQMQHTPPSVTRLLNAIANGERLREQAVVAAAARTTLERAKAEAAAAVAGERQPWMTGTAPVQPGTIPGTTGFALPARGIFTSGFGSRWGTFHNGIDIAGPIGTPIYAVANGTVIDAGPAQGFGLWVRIRHDDGSVTVYGHMYDFFVSVGERVPAGMQIARMGNRGDSTGPHLHFEVIVGGQHVDPQQWLALRGLTFG